MMFGHRATIIFKHLQTRRYYSKEFIEQYLILAKSCKILFATREVRVLEILESVLFAFVGKQVWLLIEMRRVLI